MKIKENMTLNKSDGNNLKGRILRVKHGYNPNSSSVGSVVIFAMPVAILGITAGFGIISSLILSYFVKDRSDDLKKNEQEKTT